MFLVLALIGFFFAHPDAEQNTTDLKANAPAIADHALRGAVIKADDAAAGLVADAKQKAAETVGGVVSAGKVKIDAAAATARLATIPVKGRAPKTGYSRDQFGPAWTDVDHNGCDTRDDILARDMTDDVFKPGTHNCVVLSGTLYDPYTDTVIAFQRGQRTSTAVQIDHRVPLSNAWQTGAQQWDAAKRKAFANDPANLIAVDGPTNGAKSDGDAATWLPPNTAYRCAYVAAQVQVKASYGLWVTQAEHDAIASILAGC